MSEESFSMSDDDTDDDDVSAQEDEEAYHLALPSIAGARRNYKKVRSDHILVLGGKTLTWNVLQEDMANGFAPLGTGEYNESSAERKKRHQNIANTLKDAVKEQNPNFIALQEIAVLPEDEKDSLIHMIQKELGPDWSIAIETTTPTPFSDLTPEVFSEIQSIIGSDYPVINEANNLKIIALSKFTDMEILALNRHTGKKFSRVTVFTEKEIEDLIQILNNKIIDIGYHINTNKSLIGDKKEITNLLGKIEPKNYLYQNIRCTEDEMRDIEKKLLAQGIQDQTLANKLNKKKRR